jgi:hypothetical protein
MEPLDKTVVKMQRQDHFPLQKRMEDKRPPWEYEKVLFLFSSSMQVPAEKTRTDQIEGFNSRGKTDILCENVWSFLSPNHVDFKCNSWPILQAQ